MKILNIYLGKKMKYAKPNYKIGGYINAEETITQAKKNQQSICDYLETLWNQKGATQLVIDNMIACGALQKQCKNILEIGTGSARYLEKIVKETSYTSYQSYEIQKDWADWIRTEYSVESIQSNGYSLHVTTDSSIDLLHAHGVFVYCPFLISMRYFYEMARVVKIDGHIVFDCFDESTMEGDDLISWLNSPEVYPVLISRKLIINFFNLMGFHLMENFKNKYGHGYSHYYIFKKVK